MWLPAGAAAPPLPPPPLPPDIEDIEAEVQCTECLTVITADNKSCLRTFCAACFDRNLSKNLEVQAKFEEDLCACARRPGESDSIWYARVQRMRATSTPKKQKEYLEMWRQLSEGEKRQWKADTASSAKPLVVETEAEIDPHEGSVSKTDAPASACPASVKDDDLSPQAILNEFRLVSETHSARIAHPEERWQMYLKLARLVQTGCYRSALACSQAPELKPLCVDRQKLKETMDLVPLGALAPPCPPAFRTGRSARTQLTNQEKEDLLQYIRFFAQHSMPLTVRDIENLGFVEFLFIDLFLLQVLPPLWSSQFQVR